MALKENLCWCVWGCTLMSAATDALQHVCLSDSSMMLFNGKEQQLKAWSSEKMSHPYLALYNEEVLLILINYSTAPCFCLIQLNLWLACNTVYFAWKAQWLYTCLSEIISLWDILIFHFCFPLPCALHVSSSCRVWQLACLYVSGFPSCSVSIFSSTQFWLSARPEWKQKLNVCSICSWVVGC